MIIAFVGKGGVGKTSVSSAFALELARFGKTLIVSTDFMPSLQFIFTPLDNVSVITAKEQYESISRIIREEGTIPLNVRQDLAIKAFE